AGVREVVDEGGGLDAVAAGQAVAVPDDDGTDVAALLHERHQLGQPGAAVAELAPGDRLVLELGDQVEPFAPGRLACPLLLLAEAGLLPVGPNAAVRPRRASA